MEFSTLSFLGTAEKYRDALFALVDNAEQELLLEFYIFDNDTLGNDLLQALAAASERGVTIRLILDGFGSEVLLNSSLDRLRDFPGEVRVYHPLPHTLFQARHLMRFFRDITYHIGSLNRRDHRKLVLCDGQRALLGSHNIWDKSLVWEEASLLLEGEACEDIKDSFNRIWQKTTDLSGKRNRRASLRKKLRSLKLEFDDTSCLLDNTDLKHSRLRKRAILGLIRNATKRLWIITPYFCPHRTIMRTLRQKAEAGVDVRLLLPGKLDSRLAKMFAQATYKDMLKSGIQICEYRDDVVLHAKVALIDDRMLLGSGNMNHRSIFQDLELDYLTADEKLLTAAESWHSRLISESRPVHEISEVPLYRLKKALVSLLDPVKQYF